jgi:UDP-glucose 4-epimerase|tara:strand:+ start:92 stop:1030 length:939 start_codon:yes stop_codon:yes gene_type:complete
MRVLITGGTGFVGSHLCDQLLKDGHNITLLARNENKKHNVIHNLDKIQLEYVDVTNFKQLENSIEKNNPEVIFHLAGETSHKKSFDNPVYDVDVNTKSTLCILETLRKINSKCKFILGSTFIVVGRSAKLPVTEETICNPTTVYGTNRLSSEHFSKIYHDVYGLDTIVFRITNSFGPREQSETPTKNALNFLINKAFKGEEVTIYNKGQFFRDVIYISDVISALKILMHKGKSGNLYWISSYKKTWFYEIGNWLNELTNAKIKYIDPPEYTKNVDVGNFLVNNEKLISLGWKPEITVKDGMEKTIQSFKNMI